MDCPSRRAALILGATLVPSLVGCMSLSDGSPSPDEPTPSSDNALEGIDATSRVVALSRTSAQVWLLSGGSLVGATDEARGLDGLAGDVIWLGERPDVDPGQLVGLGPDLVLTTDDAPLFPELRAALDDADVPLLSLAIGSFVEYGDAMRALTGVTGRDDLYASAVTDVADRIDEIIARSFVEDRGSCVVLRFGNDAQRLAAPDDFAVAMVEDLGLSSGVDRASELSIDELATIDPDWVFVIYQGEGGSAQEAYATLRSESAWQELSAVGQGRVVVLPQPLFEHAPCERWAECYAYLSQVLHGAWA